MKFIGVSWLSSSVMMNGGLNHHNRCMYTYTSVPALLDASECLWVSSPDTLPPPPGPDLFSKELRCFVRLSTWSETESANVLVRVSVCRQQVYSSGNLLTGGGCTEGRREMAEVLACWEGSNLNSWSCRASYVYMPMGTSDPTQCKARGIIKVKRCGETHIIALTTLTFHSDHV